MKFFILFLSLTIFSTTLLMAQTVERQVIANAGGQTSQNGISVCWTLGEAVIATVATSTIILTQGFHQPEDCGLIPTLELEDLGTMVSVFPNPALDELNIHIVGEMPKGITAILYDLNGNLLVKKSLVSSEEVLSIGNLASGHYVLTLVHQSAPPHSVQIIKP